MRAAMISESTSTPSQSKMTRSGWGMAIRNAGEKAWCGSGGAAYTNRPGFANSRSCRPPGGPVLHRIFTLIG